MVVALVFLGTALVGLIWGISQSLGPESGPRYDCRIAEISPDFTPAMKAECRKKQKEAQ